LRLKLCTHLSSPHACYMPLLPQSPPFHINNILCKIV
jgi:hypothetical protein